jgi:hypothetical protein
LHHDWAWRSFPYWSAGTSPLAKAAPKGVS